MFVVQLCSVLVGMASNHFRSSSEVKHLISRRRVVLGGLYGFFFFFSIIKGIFLPS